jgi:hypothetical protein
MSVTSPVASACVKTGVTLKETQRVRKVTKGLSGSRRDQVTEMGETSQLRPSYSVLFINYYFTYLILSPYIFTVSSSFFILIILQTVGLLGRVISSSQGLGLNTRQHKHRIKAYTHQTSMPSVAFEPTIPASEQAKTVHASDRSVNYFRGVQTKEDQRCINRVTNTGAGATCRTLAGKSESWETRR